MAVLVGDLDEEPARRHSKIFDFGNLTHSFLLLEPSRVERHENERKSGGMLTRVPGLMGQSVGFGDTSGSPRPLVRFRTPIPPITAAGCRFVTTQHALTMIVRIYLLC